MPRDDQTGTRTHHLHCFLHGSPDLHRHLVFRDFLGAHADLRLAYGELKSELAARHPEDIGAYMDGKEALVQRIQAEALAWAKKAPQGLDTHNQPVIYYP